MIKFACNIVKNHKKDIIKFYVLYFVRVIVTIVIPYFSGIVIDFIIQDDTNSISQVSIPIYIVLLVLNLLGTYFVKVYGYIYTDKITYALKREAVEKIQRGVWEKVHTYEPGYLLSRISKDLSFLVLFFLNHFINFFAKGVIIGISLIILYEVNNRFLFIIFIFGGIYLSLYKYMKQDYKNKNLVYRENADKLTNCFYENLQEVKEVKIYAYYEQMLRRLDNKYATYFSSTKKFLKYSERFKMLDSLVATVFQIVVVVFGVVQIRNGGMTIGEFTILNTYFFYCIESLRFYSDFGKVYQEFNVVCGRLKEILQIEEEMCGREKIGEVHSITVKNLTFYYSKGDALIHKLNYNFQRGNVYCITGMNGTGKSTLLDILCGVRQKNVEGEILFNDRSIREIDVIDLRKERMAIMVQETKFNNILISSFLDFDEKKDTIENIIQKYELQDIYCCDMFSIYDLFSKRMTQLSGGEKQKVRLLKALMKEGDVLFLDEPTSAMDVLTTKKIAEKLSIIKRNKIVVIITHDSNIIEEGDFVLDMGNGSR